MKEFLTPSFFRRLALNASQGFANRARIMDREELAAVGG